MMRRQDPQSRVFDDLSSLILTLLRSSPLHPISFADQTHAPAPAPAPAPLLSSSSRRLPAQITPAGFASMMLGVSMAMMLCGSVTFLIGFMLMPWVLGLVLVLYVVGLVSGISMLARALLCHLCALASPALPRPTPRTFQNGRFYDGTGGCNGRFSYAAVWDLGEAL